MRFIIMATRTAIKKLHWIIFPRVINNSALPTLSLMHGGIPAHQLSSARNKRRCQAFTMTSHPSASFNMASCRLLGREVREEPMRAATANTDFCPHKYSVLIIIGRTAQFSQTGHISREIERGTSISARSLQLLHAILLCSIFSQNTDSCKLSSPNDQWRCNTDPNAVFMWFCRLTDSGCVNWRWSITSITSSLRM